MTRRLTVVLALCAALAGCGQSASPKAPVAPSPSKSPPPADGGTYAEPRLIAAALTARTTLTCNHYSDSVVPDATWLTGTCDDLGALLVVLPDGQDPLNVAGQLASGDERYFVRGTNWLAYFGNADDAESARAGIGGTVVKVAPSPAPS